MAITISEAINNFWNSFGLTAYDENSVPDDAVLPYITYNLAESDFGNEVPMYGSLYYKSKSWEQITLKSEEISNAIKNGGIIEPCDDGAIWIKKGNPFIQRMPGFDDTIRRIYINVTVEFLTNN